MINKSEIKDFVKGRFNAENQKDLVEELVSQKQEEAKNKDFSVNDMVLVRVTSVLPENKVIKPLCQVPFVIKGSNIINDIVSDIIRETFPGNLYDPKSWDQFNKINNRFNPLSTQYRSTIHFTLNSLVQNHGAFQNVFDGQYIIIEPLKEQLQKTQFSSIRGEDTFVQDSIELSEKASILMDESAYSKLSYEKREELSKNIDIYCYTGDRDIAFKMLLMKLRICTRRSS